MSNPYATPASDGKLDERAARSSKPIRLWLFQALLLLQLIAGAMATYSVLQLPEVRALSLSALLVGLLRLMLSTPVIVMLLLALQRLGPKPRFVAPVLASVWWLLSLSSHFVFGVDPGSAPPSPAVPAWVIPSALHAVLLYFVLSAWLHRPTRAYLGRSRS